MGCHPPNALFGAVKPFDLTTWFAVSVVFQNAEAKLEAAKADEAQHAAVQADAIQRREDLLKQAELVLYEAEYVPVEDARICRLISRHTSLQGRAV